MLIFKSHALINLPFLKIDFYLIRIHFIIKLLMQNDVYQNFNFFGFKARIFFRQKFISNQGIIYCTNSCILLDIFNVFIKLQKIKRLFRAIKG